MRVRLWEPEIETKRTPETNRTPVVGARMPPWSKKPPLEPEVSPWDWDAEVLGGVNLWQFAALAGLLVVFCCLLCYWQRRANVWAIGTLQPFEYCLPFDGVESLDSWNDFVKDTCGVSLTVYTACLPGAAVPKS